MIIRWQPAHLNGFSQYMAAPFIITYMSSVAALDVAPVGPATSLGMLLLMGVGR